MSALVNDVFTQQLVHVLEENIVEACASLDWVPSVEVQSGPAVWGAATTVPHPAFNVICRACFEAGEIDRRIDDTLAWFAARRVPALWWVGPETRPADLGHRLEARGLRRLEDVRGMVLELAAVNERLSAPADLQVRPIDDPVCLAAWARIARACFEIPPELENAFRELFGGVGLGPSPAWRRYLAWLHGKPVATASLFLGRESAGIYAIATLPDVRRQGIGAAVTLAALRAARDTGYAHAILQSSAIGRNMYRRLGFRECCRYQLYSWTGTGA